MRPMIMSVSQYGISILFRCCYLPRHNCKRHSEDNHECLTCRYCKAEMSASDATKLMRGRR